MRKRTVYKKNLPTLPTIAYPCLQFLGVLIHWWSVPAPIAMVFGVGSFALAVNLLAGAPPLVQAILSTKPLRQLGIWSFSIYLWQQPLYLYVHRDGIEVASIGPVDYRRDRFILCDKKADAIISKSALGGRGASQDCCNG